MYCPDKSSQGCVYRLDPDSNGNWTARKEVCLADIASQFLHTEVLYSIGGYNRFLPLRDPETGAQVHLVGFEAQVQCNGGLPCVEKGYYSGALFFIRRGPNSYSINQVNGPNGEQGAPLVATRAYEISPFDKQSIFFAGYDCNDVIAPTNTAWVFRASMTAALTPLNQSLHALR